MTSCRCSLGNVRQVQLTSIGKGTTNSSTKWRIGVVSTHYMYSSGHKYLCIDEPSTLKNAISKNSILLLDLSDIVLCGTDSRFDGKVLISDLICFNIIATKSFVFFKVTRSTVMYFLAV